MKKNLAIALLMAGISLCAQAQENHSKDKGSTQVSGTIPVVEDALILNETEYNFGKIPQGKPVTHTFEVNNAGSTPLKISNVQASCGCTTPEWDREKDIPAGGKGTIKVGYNAAAEGVFTKSITITYGDSKTKQILIKGEVWKTPATSAPENNSLEDLKN